MFRLRSLAAFFLAFALLPACTTPASRPQMTIKPYSAIRHSTGAGVDYYELGKYYQANGKPRLAMDAYAQAMKLNSRPAEARNALAALYSQQGRLTEAENLLREIVANGPAAAYLHNNLGYIYYLQGNHAAAIGELRAAIRVDPKHEWAHNNLALAEAALARLKAVEGNTRPPRRATSAAVFEVWGESKRHDANMNEFAGAVAPAPAADTRQVAAMSDVVAQILSEPIPGRPMMKILSGNFAAPSRAMPQLAQSERVAKTAAPALVAISSDKFRLEVSNGNGVAGAAKRVGRILVRHGIPVHNLTNQLPYKQVATKIQYRDGFEREAERLRNALRGHAVIARVSTLRKRVDLRVVLGKDVTRRIAELDAASSELVATTQAETGIFYGPLGIPAIFAGRFAAAMP